MDCNHDANNKMVGRWYPKKTLCNPLLLYSNKKQMYNNIARENRRVKSIELHRWLDELKYNLLWL